MKRPIRSTPAGLLACASLGALALSMASTVNAKPQWLWEMDAARAQPTETTLDSTSGGTDTLMDNNSSPVVIVQAGGGGGVIPTYQVKSPTSCDEASNGQVTFVPATGDLAICDFTSGSAVFHNLGITLASTLPQSGGLISGVEQGASCNGNVGESGFDSSGTLLSCNYPNPGGTPVIYSNDVYVQTWNQATGCDWTSYTEGIKTYVDVSGSTYDTHIANLEFVPAWEQQGARWCP